MSFVDVLILYSDKICMPLGEFSIAFYPLQVTLVNVYHDYLECQIAEGKILFDFPQTDLLSE